MNYRQDEVRTVLDQVKADSRTTLTAPECKKICDAYGIPLPTEGLANSAEAEEASEYLYERDIVAYPYTTELPVAVLGAKYRWARAAGLL